MEVKMETYKLRMKEGIVMLQIELYEMKLHALHWWQHFHLPFFTSRGWKAILIVAFLTGGAVGILLALWILSVRGRI